VAVELVDRLVREGVPMREAHQVIGLLIRHSVDEGLKLTDFPPPELARVHPALKGLKPEDLTAQASIEAKRSEGSTAPSEVSRQVRRALRRKKG
jgi:argininosuccinate lyase